MLLLYMHWICTRDIMLPWLLVVSTIFSMVSLGKTVSSAPAVATQGMVLLVTPSCVASVCLSLRAPQHFLDYGGCRDRALPCLANDPESIEVHGGAPQFQIICLRLLKPTFNKIITLPLWAFGSANVPFASCGKYYTSTCPLPGRSTVNLSKQ